VEWEGRAFPLDHSGVHTDAPVWLAEQR
jgi:hypothetical protein